MPWGDGSDFRPKHRYSLAAAAFELGPTSAAKVALVAQLRARYVAIDAFNHSWHLNLSSWDELVKHAPPLPDTLPSEAQLDLKTFSATLASVISRPSRLPSTRKIRITSISAAALPQLPQKRLPPARATVTW